MQQRGAVLMQSRAGLLQPVRVDAKKQRDFGTAAAKAPQLSRTGDSRQPAPLRRMGEHQPIGDTGQQPQPRRLQPQDAAAKRQMQKELQEAQRSELSGSVGVGRARGAPQRPTFVPGGRYPAEMARLAQGQEPPGPFPHPLSSPPHFYSGYFSPGSPRHFSSKSSEPPDKMRQGAGTPHMPRRAVGTMAHLVSPVRVSSSPTGVSPRELHLSSPRTLANSPPVIARGFTEDNTSPRFPSDTEKTPRSAVGRQEAGSKPSPRPSAEAPIASSPRGSIAQGDGVAAPQRRRSFPKDRDDERLLRNLNLKVAETKGGRIPEKGKFPTNSGVPTMEMNKTMNNATSGRVRSNAAELEHKNPHLAGGGAIYQMERKAQFGRGGAVGPPHRDPQGVSVEPYSANPAHFPGHSIPGLQQQQMPTMPQPVRVPMSSLKVNSNRASRDTTQMAPQKQLPTLVAKKMTNSPSKSPTAFAPTLLIGSPATSPMNSPRPSIHNTATKNTTSGRIINDAKASPGSSPTRVPKSPSPRNSPARTYVVTPKHSPTALPVPPRRAPARSPQAAAIANVSTKLQIDSSVPKTTTSTTTGKGRKGRYQNPKSRLSAGGDLQTAKESPKTGAGEVGSPPADKLALAPPAQNQPSREAAESRLEADVNKEEELTKKSPRVRKLSRNSLLPVQNPSTPRSAVSDHPPDEEQVKIGNTVVKQAEGTPRKTSAGEGIKKLAPAVKNRKAATTGAVHTEGSREAPRGKTAGARHRRGREPARSLDVASALPDTSGNFTSAVHQWLRQSHYKVISPQQYRQHETIEEETAKQTGINEKIAAFRDERPLKASTPELEKAQKAASPPPPPPEKGGRRGRATATRCENIPRSLSPLSERYQPTAKGPRPLRRAPLSLLMKQKDIVVMPKTAAAAPAGRGGKKASKTAAANPEAGKRKAVAKKGTAKGRGARRKKDKEKERPPGKLPPSACPRLRPKVGPAGDSGDLSSSSEDSSFLSASDEAMNEQSAMC